MEHTAPAHSRGYYATRAAVRATVYTAISAAFLALPGMVEAAARGLGL